MTFVKICGITNLGDALQAVEAGANALGFNFYAGSPRCVTPEAAKEIIESLPAGVRSIGVFVNEPVDRIVEIARMSRIDEIQLHGEETPENVSEVATGSGLPVIKAFRVDGGFDLKIFDAYEADAVLLDGLSAAGHGGMGVKADWTIARIAVSLGKRVYLAGGLSPENVAQAIAAVEPFAVDACSQLESSKGKKDPDKVRSFIENANKQ